MDGEKFRKIIQSGTDEYSSEIWFFLRELAQNSRDAEANYIRVTTGYLNENTEFIRFEDDGIGMSREHANDYLFKLYASSKENQQDSIGKYGIGFWTLLKFEPYKVIIESKFKNEKWAILLNTKLEIETIPPTIKKRGTRVTLLRIGKFNDPETYINRVKSELKKYSKYLTKKKGFEPLPVLFNDELINRKMELPGTLSRKIKHKNLRGIVALGKEPMVMLYSKGLPVWTGSVLSDLSDHSQNNDKRFETGKGLTPVFLLNSSNIDINFSRNVPIDNKNLIRMIDIAEKELSKLIFGFIKTTTPWSFFKSLIEVFKKSLNIIKKSLYLKMFILLTLLIPIEIYFLNNFFSKKEQKTIYRSDLSVENISNSSPKTSSALSVRDDIYSGASVHLGDGPAKLDISYTPKVDGLFKLYPANKYDIKHGFIYTSSISLKTKEIDIQQKGFSFIIENADIGKSFLLNKNNFSVNTRDIKVNGRVINRDIIEHFDNMVQINLIDNKNLIEYQIYPLKNRDILSEIDKNKYLQLPAIIIPDFILKRLEKIKNLNILEKVKQVEVLTRDLLKYDDSVGIVEKYQSLQNTNWLEKVLKIKAGDCDVINGVNALLLRKVNIPSKLIIGFIGKNGKILPELHAWTEYYNNEWQTIDVSTIIQNNISHDIKNTPMQINKEQSTKSKIEEYKVTNNGLVQVFIIIFLILVSVFLFIFVLKIKKKKEFKIKNAIMAHSLSEIAVNALLYPEIWKSKYVWKYKFIPIFGYKHISLENILLKAKKRLIFKSSCDNTLLSRKMKNLSILDSNDKYYSNLIRSIPGIIDLDRIEALEVQLIQEADIRIPDLQSILRAVNVLLNKATNGILKIFLSSNFDGLLINIKSSKYIHPYSDQFVLINPEYPRIEEFIKDPSNMRYSIFIFIEKILDNFDLQNTEIILIKKRVSKLLLKQKHG